MPNPPFRSYRHLAAHLTAVAFVLVAGLHAIPLFVTTIGAFVK